jgi:PAS domain S-box-containing protein
VLVNAQIEKVFGYNRSELLGQPMEVLVPVRFREQHPGHRKMFFSAPSQRAMGAGRELYGLRKNGSEFPLEIGLNPIETMDGVMVMASIIDITERKQAEEQFRLVVESAPCGLVMIDETGSMLLVNPELEKQFGYSKQEMMGQRIEMLVPERFRGQHPAHRQSFNRLPAARAMGAGRDLHGLRKDGSEFPVEIALNPIDTSSGSRTLGIVVDISERKRVERQTRLSEFAVNQSSMPTLWITPEGKVFRVNQATFNMMGYAEEELLRMTVQDFNPAFPVDKWTVHFQELKEKQHITYESSLRHKDGHMFPVEVRSNFLEFEGQEYNVKFVADITDRKLAEAYSAQQNAELIRSNSELEQFAYVASHDLQEPLRMVSSYCGLLARRYKGKLDKDADEFIDFAVDGATRMKHLIDDLMHYSRVGRKGKPFTPIDSSDCVWAAVANLGVAIEEAHAVITCDPLPKVFADSGQLMQVFQNLIGNALKFRGDQDARIRISARCLSRSDGLLQWEFSVQDNGIGIEQQFDERVFVIFQRLHTRDQYPGNGMGLAITKKIIERHGGRIWLESIPATGTTFFFTLRGLPSDGLPVELAMAGLSR